MTSRAVNWGDLHNAWDLGKLPTATGATRSGRVFRSMNPDPLDAAGWVDIRRAGIVTIVDLRNDDEIGDAAHRPEELAVVRAPIEDQANSEFMAEWGDRLGSPVYYAEILRRWPGLVAAVFIAIADAPGPVLFHCGAGRDRTGMISAMLEELVGVDRAAILDDYAAGVRAFNIWKRSNTTREQPQTDEQVDAHLATALAELTVFLDGCDVELYLAGAGVSSQQLERIRERLLEA